MSNYHVAKCTSAAKAEAWAAQTAAATGVPYVTGPCPHGTSAYVVYRAAGPVKP